MRDNKTVKDAMNVKKLITLTFLLFSLLIQNSAWCWNRAYHLIIAQIAFDQLTVAQQKKLQTELAKSNYFPEKNNYLHATVFPDEIKKNNKKWQRWHYINLPYSSDGTKATAAKSPNVVSVIKKSMHELKQPNLPNDEKGLFLSLLMHMTGDIHQPLHCINLFSKQFPRGDKGGNLFLLPNRKTPNLHALWDDALELRQTFYPDGRLSFKKIKDIAHHLETRYPKSQFKDELTKTTPLAWAKESYQIAIQSAYKTPFNKNPNLNYIKHGQSVSAKQITLAGYRLAEALKQILN